MQVKDLDNNFSTEFKTFCSVLHENFLQNERMHEIMTSAKEQSLVDYLLTPQSSNNCNVDLSNWLQNYVFCVVTNEAQTTYELHIWMEDQKRVVSIENYFSTLCSLYAELDHITAESFIKKVNEMYALIPEEVASFFINRCLSNKESKLRTALNYRETKENVMYGCKVISYEYIKKKVVKKKVLTEIFNKSTGKVVQSKFQEEEPSEDFFYCVKKNERLLDITNNKQTEISLTDYASSHALQVKFLGQTVLAYFPPDEIQNHDHLVTLSGLIYKDREASTGKSGEIQMEFIVPNVPQESPEIAPLDLEDIFSRSTASESDHVYEKSPKKKNLKNRGNPNILMNLRGKLSLVTDPKTKCSTLKCIPIDNHDENHTQKLTLDLLKANAVQYTDSVDAIESLDVDTSISNDVEIGESGKLTEPSSDQVSQNYFGKDMESFNESQIIEKMILQGTISAAQCDFDSVEFNDIKPARRTKIKPEKQVIIALKCSVCSKVSIDLTAAKRHRKIHDNIEYKCKICGKVYNSGSGLEYHKLKHNDVKDLIDCQYCSKKFENSHLIRQHVRKSHFKIYKKEHPCKYCDRIFTSYSGCRNHIEAFHRMQPTASKPEGPVETEYICKHCAKSYKQQRSLAEHLKLHTCSLCKVEFQSIKVANKHRVANHLDVLSVKCPYCDKMCTSKKAYKRHMEFHRSASYRECSVCFEVFDDDELLSIHAKLHKFSQYPFICSMCPESFVLRSDFDEHSSSHHSFVMLEDQIKAEPVD